MDVNIIVCTDPARCLHRSSHGRNAEQLLQELQHAVDQHRLQEQVQVTACRCIFGCTYGPRIDVARRWSGEKLLYGTVQGQADITRRGAVRFSKIPEDLLDLLKENLPR